MTFKAGDRVAIKGEKYSLELSYIVEDTRPLGSIKLTIFESPEWYDPSYFELIEPTKPVEEGEDWI